jgi:hypothetical protein
MVGPRVGVEARVHHPVLAQQQELDLLHLLHHLGQSRTARERVGHPMRKLLEQERRIEAHLHQAATVLLPLLYCLSVQNQIVQRSTSISMDLSTINLMHMGLQKMKTQRMLQVCQRMMRAMQKLQVQLCQSNHLKS